MDRWRGSSCPSQAPRAILPAGVMAAGWGSLAICPQLVPALERKKQGPGGLGSAAEYGSWGVSGRAVGTSHTCPMMVS